MILAQPGKRDIAQRHDGQWNIYRFDPTLETSMQWEIIDVVKSRAAAIAAAFPKKVVAA